MKKEQNNRPLKGQSGFTLIEVLLVVAILGILAGIVVVNFGGKQKGAMEKAARASIAAVSTAIDMYEVDTGKYPSTLKDLVQNDGSPNWSGPYIRGQVPTDPWGSPFDFRQVGDTGYKIVSPGPDMSLGSVDDIESF